MNPKDPVAQSIDFDLAEGMTDPTRAAAIMRILPQLTGSQPNTRPIGDYSGLPQTGGQALADVASLAGQIPSGVPGDTRMPSLGEIYQNRALMTQRGDIANEELINRRTQNAIEIAKMLGKGEQWEPVVRNGRVVGQRNAATGELKGAGLERPEKTTVAPGSVVLGEDGKVLFQAPDRESLQPVEGMVFDKRTGEYKDSTGKVLSPDEVTARIRELAFARSTKVNQNVVMPTEEKEEAKAVGKAQGENYVVIQKAGQDALTKISRLDRFAQLSSGVETGRATPAMTEIQAWADSMGLKINTKGLNQKQAMDALTNEMALQARNPAGGAGMPGAMSDKDREFLVNMMPGLSRTPGGNKLLIETMKKLAQRDVEVAQLARDYRNRRGKLDEGFYNELRQFSEANPLFSNTRKPLSAFGSP